ncbi:MAG: hypothetical protein KGJ25_07965, partial [Betaproteobacteria bacterium]|nr:hypothetical protein [Betaproteobacteria bacterium]
MRRALLPLLILGCVAIAAALAWLTLDHARMPKVPAASTAATLQTRSLPPFHRIEVGGVADVTLVQGDAESVEMSV